MLPKTNKKYSLSNITFRIAFFLPLILCLFVTVGFAQNGEIKKISAKIDQPLWQNYKGVAIGMTAEEVRAKLGEPKSEDAQGFFYTPSETETLQVLLDQAKKVRTVSVIFSAEHPNQPKFTDVFEKTTVLDPRPDGSLYKLVRYTEAGYWVSYNRMAGEKAMVIVVIQKL